MVPVYLNFEEVRNARKITIIRHIEGDIWVIHLYCIVFSLPLIERNWPRNLCLINLSP
jgi:hypothetical protein